MEKDARDLRLFNSMSYALLMKLRDREIKCPGGIAGKWKKMGPKYDFVRHETQAFQNGKLTRMRPNYLQPQISMCFK